MSRDHVIAMVAKSTVDVLRDPARRTRARQILAGSIVKVRAELIRLFTAGVGDRG